MPLEYRSSEASCFIAIGFKTNHTCVSVLGTSVSCPLYWGGACACGCFPSHQLHIFHIHTRLANILREVGMPSGDVISGWQLIRVYIENLQVNMLYKHCEKYKNSTTVLKNNVKPIGKHRALSLEITCNFRLYLKIGRAGVKPSWKH